MKTVEYKHYNNKTYELTINNDELVGIKVKNNKGAWSKFNENNMLAITIFANYKYDEAA